MKLFFGKFSNKSVNFGDKNWCFCEKPKYFVSKSTPSISRIFSPKTRHSICDHLELIFTEKKHKNEQNWRFSATLWWPTFPIRPCPIYLWKSSHPPKITSTLDKLFTKKYKKITFFVVFFRSSKPIKKCYFLVKTDWLGWILKGKSRQNHDIFWDPTLLQFSRKYDQIKSL